MNKTVVPTRLNDIDMMRCIVVFMLIVMHCMTMYTGNNPSWTLPEGICPIFGYSMIQKYTYAFLLEAFTFMSGFVYCYGIAKKGKQTIIAIVIAKIKRLIVPSVVFSIAFAFLFRRDTFTSIRGVYDILIGIGHLWYLPMLFWCFIFTHYIMKLRLKDSYLLIILVLVSAFSYVIPNYTRISQASYYELYFFLGYLTYKYKFFIKKNIISVIFLLVIIPILLLLKERICLTNISLSNALQNSITIAYSTIGTFSVFSLCHNVIEKNTRENQDKYL